MLLAVGRQSLPVADQGTELCRLVLCMNVLVGGNPALSHLLMCKNFQTRPLGKIPQDQGLLPSLYLYV